MRDIHPQHKQPSQSHSFPGITRGPKTPWPERVNHGQQPVHADEGDEDGAGADVVSEKQGDRRASNTAQRPGTCGVKVDPHRQGDYQQQVRDSQVHQEDGAGRFETVIAK